MTTITAWLSVSGTGKRTFYLGADSQGTSPETGKAISNNVKKLYVSDATAEIFAFSGDVRWAQHFLRNLRLVIKAGKITAPVATIDRVIEFSEQSFAKPSQHPTCELEVLYAARCGDGFESEFHLYQLLHQGNSSDSWQISRIGGNKLESSTSILVYSSGFGGEHHIKRQDWIAGGDQGDRARTYFWSLCDLVNGVPRNDLMTGGFPQLAKLDQAGLGQAVGVKYHGLPTVYGHVVTEPSTAANVWVDQDFVQLNPVTLKPYSNAQLYARREIGR